MKRPRQWRRLKAGLIRDKGIQRVARIARTAFAAPAQNADQSPQNPHTRTHPIRHNAERKAPTSQRGNT